MWATVNSQSIFSKKAQEECVDEQKLCNVASKVAIWDHFGIPQAQYLALDTKEKLKMLDEYYKKLVPAYFGDGKNGSFFFVWILAYFFCLRSELLLPVFLSSFRMFDLKISSVVALAWL